MSVSSVFASGAVVGGAFDSSSPKISIDGSLRSPDSSECTPDAVIWHFGDIEWIWRIAAEGDWTIVRSEIHNRGKADVKLGRCDILDAGAGVLGKPPDIRFLDMQRLQARQRTVRSVRDPMAAHDVPIHIQFADPDGTFALQFGFTTFTTLETTCHWEGANGVERVRASGAFEDWTLKAGESTPFEEFAVAVGRDPHAQLVRWAEIVAANYRPQFIRTPALGLSGGAWTYLAVGTPESSEESKYNKTVARFRSCCRDMASNTPGSATRTFLEATPAIGRDGTSRTIRLGGTGQRSGFRISAGPWAHGPGRLC